MMTKSGRLLAAVSLLSTPLAMGGCDDKSTPATSSASSQTADNTEPVPSASTSASAAPAAEPSPLAAFFVGPAPKVEMGKTVSSNSLGYSVTIAKGWKSGGRRGGYYMAMRDKAALFCDTGGIKVSELKMVSKYAPVFGKDLEVSRDVAVLELGGDTPFTARVGEGKGNFFKSGGGQLWWADVIYQDGSGKYCMVCVSGDADDAVIDEAKAVLRSFAPYKGRKVVSDRPKALAD